MKLSQNGRDAASTSFFLPAPAFNRNFSIAQPSHECLSMGQSQSLDFCCTNRKNNEATVKDIACAKAAAAEARDNAKADCLVPVTDGNTFSPIKEASPFESVHELLVGPRKATTTPLTGSPGANSTTRSEKAVGDFGLTLTSAFARFAEMASRRVRWATRAEVEMSSIPNMGQGPGGRARAAITVARGSPC